MKMDTRELRHLSVFAYGVTNAAITESISIPARTDRKDALPLLQEEMGYAGDSAAERLVTAPGGLALRPR